MVRDDSAEKSAQTKSDLSNSTTNDSHESHESRHSTGSSESDNDDSDIHSHHSLHDYTGDVPELHLTPHVSRASEAAARARSRSRSKASLDRTQTNGTNITNSDPAFEVDFTDNDKGNPLDWPFWYKAIVMFAMSFGTTTVVMYSTSYTAPIPGLMKDFGITEQIGVLGVTTYLLGMSAGAIVLAPLSEMYGRRPVYVVAMILFSILIIPCALAKNIATILATRFFGAFAAAAMISNAPGSISDMIYPEYRALAFSVWSIGPMNGPVLGPVVGGFVYQYLDWRWTYWVVLIMSAFAWAMVSAVPETYAPTILRKRAADKRKSTGDERWFCRYDDKESFWILLKVNLSRPFILMVTEPILIFWNSFCGLTYGGLYLCFVAYPIVFSQQRGWSPGFTGLAFSGIGVGVLTCIAAEPLIRRAINSHKPDPLTGKPPPEAMVLPICIAALLMPLGELWFAWTCTPNVHWIAPILAGIPYGAGCTGIFIYSANYLVHSYGMYAASALAGNALFRSILGATLPLAGPALYRNLGSNWAGTLLACLEFAFVPIPFVFYRYGGRIRMKSALIRRMQEEQDRKERRKKRLEEKLAGRVIVDEKTADDGLRVEEEEDPEEAARHEKRFERTVEKRLEAEAYVGEVNDTGAAIDEVELEKGAQQRGRRH